MNVAVNCDYRRQGTLTETGHGSYGKFQVFGGKKFLTFPEGLFTAQHYGQFFRKISGTSGVARGSPADHDGMFSLRFEVKKGIEGNHTVDLGKGEPYFLADVFQGFLRQVFVFVLFLDLFQYPEKVTG